MDSHWPSWKFPPTDSRLAQPLTARPPSLCAHEVDVRLHRFIRRRHLSPVLGVMISIDDSEYCTVHMSVFCAAGDVEKVECHSLAIW
jgi:hypothetical protein